MIFGTNPTPKTLIVVYKDEMLLNQLKKMVESNDDVDIEKAVGATGNPINIVAWSEKVWLGNKKAGNINSKVLFLGEISGSDKLIPVIDIKYDEYGVKFGWAGNQAILYAEPKELASNEKYLEFAHELVKEPVPEMIKHPKSIRIKDEEKAVEAAAAGENPIEVEDEAEKHTPKIKIKTPEFVLKAKDGVEKSLRKAADKVSDVGETIADKAEEVLRDKKTVKRQMLFFGAVKLYQNCLNDFMNV